MGFYNDRILPRLVDWVCSGREFNKYRAQLLKNIQGEVLEVGFGSGTNLPYYPSSVTCLYAVDPARLGRRLAKKRLKKTSFPVRFIDFNEEGNIDLPNHSVDAVVSTWTLCTIPDLAEALLDIRRVLKPGGKLYFLEHGLSPHKNVALWQHRLNPWQKRIAGGCHLNRKIDERLKGAGFKVIQLKNYYMKGPASHGYMYQGEAV